MSSSRSIRVSQARRLPIASHHAAAIAARRSGSNRDLGDGQRQRQKPGHSRSDRWVPSSFLITTAQPLADGRRAQSASVRRPPTSTS